MVRVIGESELQYSFPSGHATYTVLAVISLWPLVPSRLRIGLLAWLVWVGWSRIAVGAHFPADIFAGWVLGLLCFATASQVLKAWISLNKCVASEIVWRWYGLAAFVVFLDQVSKTVIVNNFAYMEQVRLTSFFNLVYVSNAGAAFSFLAEQGGWQRYGLIALALFVSVWLALMLHKRPPFAEAISGSLILGGALGNVIDRLSRGSVVDFLDLHWGVVHWPAFNFADVGICFGVALLFWASFDKSKQKKITVSDP
jgi:signal peptidase II